MKKLLKTIIERAAVYNLPSGDIASAQEYLEYNEHGLCLDHIVTQLYEFSIKIDNDFYQMVVRAAKDMRIPISKVSYLEELISVE